MSIYRLLDKPGFLIPRIYRNTCPQPGKQLFVSVVVHVIVVNRVITCFTCLLAVYTARVIKIF